MPIRMEHHISKDNIGKEKIMKPLNNMPFMPSKKKAVASSESLKAFYKDLHDFYLSLPYDKNKVMVEETRYRRIANLAMLFARLKGTKALHEERIYNDQTLIYTANHIGSFDQFYLTTVLESTPIHYLVKKKVTKWIIRWRFLYKPTGVVIIDTDSASSWKKAKEKLIQYLLNGSSVFIFAEGSRRGEDNIGKFSSGLAQIAQESGVKVCTLAPKNTYKLFSRNPIVCVGETFSIGPREDIKEATECIKSGVLRAYNEILTYESG